MRVLTVIPEMGSGGAEAVVHDLTGRLRAAGVGVSVASNGGWRADELAAAGVSTPYVPLRDPGVPALLRSARAVRRLVAGWRPDVVHAHNVRATAAVHGARLGRRRPPVMTTVHGLADGDYRPAARILGRCSDVVVAVSGDVRDRLVHAGLEADRVRVIENAVPDPGPSVDGVRAELGLRADVPLVLCAARLRAPKRVDLLVDAWGDVPDAHLVVAGGGPDRPALERRAAAHGVADRVTFLGDRDDVDRLLGSADLLVLPSDREGLPRAVLEAMAAGVPVLASAVGGLRDLDPRAIALAEPGTADALGTAVGALLADRAVLARLAENGRELVRTRYSLDRMTAEYRIGYEGLVEQGARS